VLVVGFVVLSSAFRSPARLPAGPAPASSPPNPQSLVDEDAASAEPIELVPLRQHGPSAALRRELHVMVREHPQAAVGVLRSWLSNAS
jgi:flagellar biosynthesis/type III secretory pathway M-ring protein FliF/YscJ